MTTVAYGRTSVPGVSTDETNNNVESMLTKPIPQNWQKNPIPHTEVHVMSMSSCKKYNESFFPRIVIPVNGMF